MREKQREKRDMRRMDVFEEHSFRERTRPFLLSFTIILRLSGRGEMSSERSAHKGTRTALSWTHRGQELGEPHGIDVEKKKKNDENDRCPPR